MRCHASFTSPHIRRLNAFSLSGRFKVMVATRAWASTSRVIVSKPSSLTASFRLPVGIALLEERARPLLGIVGVQHPLAVRLGQELGFVQRETQPLPDR